MANIGKKHQNKIRARATKNPMESYFLGGFDLLKPRQQANVMKELDKMMKKGKK